MSIPHPIPYQGSKRSIARTILEHFGDDAGRLIEPFAGSAAVALAAAYHGKAQRFLLNDINHPLMELWNRIIDHPGEIADAYEKLWMEQSGREREHYDIVRDTFNRTHRPDCLLYLLARCVKASVRYNSNGEFNQSPDNRRKGARPGTMRTHIAGASQLLRGRTVIRSMNYLEILEGARTTDVVYMDPPSQAVSGKRDQRYIKGVLVQEFVDALHDLNRRDIPYLVSYDGRTGNKIHGEPLPHSLELTRVEIDAGRSTQATLLGKESNTVESLYISPALAARLHIRRRQTIGSSSRTQISIFEVSA